MVTSKGRLDLTRACMRHWRWIADLLDGVVDVRVCLTGSDGDPTIATDYGHTYSEFPNDPLGVKRDHALSVCRATEPDAVMVTGSDDFFSKELVSFQCYLVRDQGVESAGILDGYFLKLETKEMVYWPGYEGDRAGHSIGCGKIISSKVLDRLDWSVWGDYEGHHAFDSVLDRKIETVSPKTVGHRMARAGLVVATKATESLTEWGAFDHYARHPKDCLLALGETTRVYLLTCGGNG